ncbi:hypothetical protein [Mycobacterium sp. IDR2000157661]|uniref:hypothetical protein n=1 Tax=Mycobacterium sp. IDR2000157661 TaxID=2867005 RepID=UPI001EEDB311|nr:hypothetical protein [Mycobacterium sp. IDR2000157661]
MLGLNWGATPAELAARLPCDALVDEVRTQADRAISVAAPPSLVFSWLCQLRVAPYSYDLLDNLGRLSPRQRTPELEHLALGQRFMAIFTLKSFIPGMEITLRTTRVAVTYTVRPQDVGTRLHARVMFEVPWPIGHVAALGDLVMMRKQFLTLKWLAEEEALMRQGFRAVPHGRRDDVET